MGALLIDLGLLVLACYLASHRLAPSFGSPGLWFYSGALAVVLADLVVEPWYTRPADALMNAVAVIVAVVTASRSGLLHVSHGTFTAGRIGLIVFAGLVGIAAILAMATKPHRGEVATGGLHRASYLAASTLGRARTLFTVLFAVSAAAAYADNSGRLLILYLWLAIVLLERFPERLLSRLPQRSAMEEGLTVLRTVEPRSASVAVNTAAASIGDVVYRDSEAIGVVTYVDSASAEQTAEIFLNPGVRVRDGAALRVESSEGAETPVGTVATGSTLERLIIRMSGERADAELLREGSLVQCSIREESVLYQLVSAEIATGSPQLAAQATKLLVTARKLGIWDVERNTFQPVQWLPDPGEPVTRPRVPVLDQGADSRFIGVVPGTGYGVAFDVSEGVTHNTAVFGILGSGKTRVAAELIWRAVGEGTKVVVLDITGQWSGLFGELDAASTQAGFEADVAADINARTGARNVDGENAGNIRAFRRSIKSHLESFLESDAPLLVCDPSRWAVTQELGFLRNASAEVLRSLTPAEVTSCFAAALLELASLEEREHAHICLVLEEAHTLAPEWNAIAHDKERQATIATSRALLQGRKFGLGCIVVTQRTANVAKTVLNQCNTIVALRVYDQTGAEFLAHFIGADYSSLLATLPNRTAVVFGRGSSCQTPLVVALNNWADMSELRQRIGAACAQSRGSQASDEGPVAPEA